MSKSYPFGGTQLPAVREVTLNVSEGEFVAVWGPSGSGKTTLLNLIGLIDEPTAGRIFFRDRDMGRLTDNQKAEIRNRELGFIFQHFNLIPVLSALENVMLPLQIQGRSTREARQRALARLEQMGLTRFKDHRPDKLSGGQQQRVAIARALVTNPALVVADEPTANLDSKTAVKILEIMRELNRHERTTFIFSTHDQRLLGRVDRRIEMEDGSVRSEVFGEHSMGEDRFSQFDQK
ncbi:ABC transporter ATP-binding protein [Desulfosoma sp.]